MREANFQAFSGDESACEDDTDITVLRRTTEETAQWCVERAKALGASSASAEASFDRGLSASTRMCEPESIERTEESVLVVNVWKGAQRGTASTSDLSEASLERTVRAAVQIASHAKPDPAGGLPDEADLATEFPDLSLYHPFAGTPEEAFRQLERTEAAALAADARITNTEGARFDTSAGVFTLANSLGFCAGYAYGRHSIDCWPIAQSPEGESQRDGWWCEARALEDLMSPEALGALAAQRAVRRLDAGAVSPGRYNVLFEPQAAVGLLDILEALLSGSALYRKASCLGDKFGERILPEHVSVEENPFVARAIGSGAFDDEGCAGRRRLIVDSGRLEGRFLSSYSARKLGLRTTGNAGGAYNLTLSSSQTRTSDDFTAMLKKLDRGILVTELIGQGFNPVTGDYSRGAFGFWVENGRIDHAIEGFSIAGNILEMMMQLEAVGADRLTASERSCGSLLFSDLCAAGVDFDDEAAADE